MSYTILYDRLFIKMKDGTVLPLIKSGSNNLYDINYRGREVRTRNWEVWNILPGEKPFPACTPDQIADYLDKEHRKAKERAARNGADGRPHMDPDRNFGYYASVALSGRHTTRTSFRSFRGIFTDGVAKAVPFDTYAAACFGLQVQWHHKEAGREFGGWHKSENLLTEADLRRAWAEAATLANDGGPWISPVNDYKVDRLAALINAVPPRKGTRCARLYVRLADGTQGFLKSVYPFSYTENEKDAMSFSTATLDKVRILDVIPGADSAYYENVT